MKRFYRPELDALRFFAFLGVFLFHGMAFYLPTEVGHSERFHLSWVGMYCVPLFFFLSAYLITELLLRERDAVGTVSVGPFYLRRMLRIWPLYFAMFYGLAALNHVVPGVNPHVRSSWPSFTFFLGNWYFAHHGWTGGPLDPLWTISVEEQFYILIPLIAAIGGRRALRTVSVLVIAMSYGTIWHYASQSDGVPWSHEIAQWLNSLVQFQFFAGGTLLAAGLRGRVPEWSMRTRAFAFAGGFGCWVVAQTVFGIRGGTPFISVGKSLAGTPLILIGCSLFLLAALGIAAERIPQWLAYLGRISYGLYVIHGLVFVIVGIGVGARILRRFPVGSPGFRPVAWVAVVCVLAITIGVAHLSYRYFERPFLLLKQRFERVPSRPEHLRAGFGIGTRIAAEEEGAAIRSGA